MEGREESRALIKKAESKLRSAKLLLIEGELEDAVSRAYYAAYNAARAVLLLLGEDASTHGGVAFKLWTRLVEPGLLDREYARILSKLREAREEGDYTPLFTLSTKEVQDLVEDAERFVARMKELMDEMEKVSNCPGT
ncbi:MAG: HEPN domain-containing protein [Candidatus Korarchaeota archaeon]|nr:HEPN domain-containing protein [Candidatus Korarchaeota archaeon]